MKILKVFCLIPLVVVSFSANSIFQTNFNPDNVPDNSAGRNPYVATFSIKNQDTFNYKIAILGNPVNPDSRYSDEQMQELKRLGFNTIQLNIAWGSRPGGEPLNLEDILPYEKEQPTEQQIKWLKEIKRRAVISKKYGFRTIFHFGAPIVKPLYKLIGNPHKIDSATSLNNVQRPEIKARYKYLISTLAREVPEIDDILVYNFDQEAWQGNEFGNSSLDAGIPLHERLPAFIKMMCTTWADFRTNGIMWWEPWEISAGQMFSMLDSLPSKNFGFMLHSNIGEVQLARPVDGWLRNMSMYAQDRNIPLVVETFLSSSNEETEDLANVAMPQLIFNQLQAIRSLPYVSGVKEYYGIVPDKTNPNLNMAGLIFNDPDISIDDAINDLTVPFKQSSAYIKKAWESASMGYSCIPWDGSWLIRAFCAGRKMSYHSWKAFNQNGKVAASPSWNSTRRGIFMLTDNEKNNDLWLIEDLGLRFYKSSESFDKAIAYYDSALLITTDALKATIQNWRNDILILSVRSRDYGLHAMETLAAHNIRRMLESNKEVPKSFYTRLEFLLEQDVKNQSRYQMPKIYFTTTSEKLKEYRENNQKWVMNNLLFNK